MISASVSGISEAVRAIEELVTPWKRHHAKKMAALRESELAANLQSKQIADLEARARIHRENAESEHIRAQIELKREEAARIRHETKHLQLELHKSKIELALKLVDWANPDLTEQDRVSYMAKLLDPLDGIVSSLLELELKENE